MAKKSLTSNQLVNESFGMSFSFLESKSPSYHTWIMDLGCLLKDSSCSISFISTIFLIQDNQHLQVIGKGLFKQVTQVGHNYFLTIMDDCTSYTWVHPLFHKLVLTQFNIRIKAIQTNMQRMSNWSLKPSQPRLRPSPPNYHSQDQMRLGQPKASRPIETETESSRLFHPRPKASRPTEDIPTR
ncbi:hypothetical protein CR513_25928, partial [Mucuna pruriens]